MKSFLPNPNYQIEVFDNLFTVPQIELLYRESLRLPYTNNNLDHRDSSVNYYKFWSKIYTENTPLPSYHSEEFFKLINSSSSFIISEKKLLNYFLERAYVNYSVSSNVDRLHTDAYRENEYTILIYANKYWDLDWGGETLFYDSITLEIITAVKPVPGRIVLFKGNIPHSARPPQIHCPYPRYTIALKFIQKN